MKNLFTLISLFAFIVGANSLNAQNIFPNNGNVGIGTTNPKHKLHIAGAYPNFMLISGIAPGIIFSRDNTTSLSRASVGLATSSGHFFSSSRPGDFGFRSSGGGDFLFGTLASSSSTNGIVRMRIKNNGNIGIGSENPDERLTVKGTIHAEEIKVDLAVPADYVFEKYFNGSSNLKNDYEIPTLKEVETFIKKNYHLPDVPSAFEIQENGLYLKQMTNTLLQKIEELTLYIIEQQKQLESLEYKFSTIK